MVKVNKRKKLSDNINKKKDDKKAKKSTNPFEVHINKEKHTIIGRKLKSDRGLPGVARAKAIKKRKHTLLQEYNVLNKSNKFVDRRIGERNKTMTDEERKMARFTAERIKSHNKKSIFNLADDEILTHKGQTLSEIEKFDDPRSDDDSEDEEGRISSGKLDDEFVDNAHFGGGILKKTGIEGAKSHKDLIDQLIAESKKRKAEKQKIREQTLDLTEKLDTEWKDLLPLVNKSKNTPDVPEPKKVVDDYDKTMRQLKFEARGIPSDRLKTEEEIAKEEKERLEQLENDRLERMKGFIKKDEEKSKHRSADDLDDNFAYDSDPEVMLAYNEEGKSIIDLKPPEKEVDEEKSEESAEEEEEEEAETESEDDLSDLKEDDDSSGDEEVEPKTTEVKLAAEKITTEVKLAAEKITTEVKPAIVEKITSEVGAPPKKLTVEEIKADLMNRKDMMDKARKELPYTFAMPESYEDLQTLLANRSSEYQSIIIERTIKCNHPSLAEDNKTKLGNLFIYLLQYINDVSVEQYSDTNIKLSFQTFNALVPHMYDLAQTNPINALNSLIDVIKEKQGDYRLKPKCYPGIEVLIYLKLVSLLFPTSDFRHQAVTPSIVFMDQMLTTCRVRTQRDITYGLFLVTLLLEYITLSKRYIPSALIYLSGLVHMAIPKTVQLLKVIPPFKPNSTLLVLTKSHTECDSLTMHLDDFITNDIDDKFKIRCLHTVMKLAGEFFEHWNILSSSTAIFQPFLNFVEKLPVSLYPEGVQEVISHLRKALLDAKVNQKLHYIVYEKKRPKALRLYEPNIEKVFDGKKRKIQSKEKAEREKLLHKYKQERKGALREIRKDQAFLGRIKIKQQIQSDYERKEKVKRIYAEASIQQSELNAIDRKKKMK